MKYQYQVNYNRSLALKIKATLLNFYLNINKKHNPNFYKAPYIMISTYNVYFQLTSLITHFVGGGIIDYNY